MSQSISTTHKTTYITLGMMLGAAAGVVAGILTAPRSGLETRSRIRVKAMDAKSSAIEKMDKSLQKTKDMASRVTGKKANRTSEGDIKSDPDTLL